eukprot:7500420-Lingulodinium_polyedra.AAC.1
MHRQQVGQCGQLLLQPPGVPCCWPGRPGLCLPGLSPQRQHHLLPQGLWPIFRQSQTVFHSGCTELLGLRQAPAHPSQG